MSPFIKEVSMMKQIIIFAACIAAACSWGQWNEGLSVRFDIGLFGAGTDFFITIPRTVTAAKNSRWIETPRPEGPLPSLVMFCPSRNDVVVCGLFDDNGNIAGLQVALPEDSWTDAVFDNAVQGFTRWVAPANSDGVERAYWITQQFYVSEATLKKSKEERLASYVPGRILQEEAVWVTGFYGELMRISGSASDIADTAKSGFTEQGCVPMQGRHYYYNMTATSTCSAETILPWFAMVDKSTDQLVATGFMTEGQLPPNLLVKDYFERTTRNQVKNLLVPSGPDCLYDMADDPGAISMHIYYVDSPFLINCINN